MQEPFISVVIPVYNDSARLIQCLKALEQQIYPYYEVIVVNNNSTEDIHSLCQPFINVRYCQEFKPGNNAARNQGISVAKGEIIAITDADCIPDPNWLLEAVKRFNSGADIIGGAIHFFYKAKRPNVIEYVDRLSYLRQEDYITQEHYAAGANLLIRREVLNQVGWFEERLLNLGDKELGQRAHAAGFEIVYCPTAIVWHPARATLKALLQKGRRQARAAVKLAALKGQPHPRASFLPLGFPFWQAVAVDPNLPRLRQKLAFIAVSHCLKWAIAWELLQQRRQVK